MNTKKTCGECKHFEVDVVAATCEKKLWISDDNTPACKKFERKPITNGDVIRQGNNRKLAEIFGKLDNGNKCKYCICHNYKWPICCQLIHNYSYFLFIFFITISFAIRRSSLFNTTT